jgi:hypothetical protein
MKQIRKQTREQRSDITSFQGGPPWGRSHGRVSIELRIRQEDLRASIREGNDWVTIKDILNALQFDVKIVNMVIVFDKDNLISDSHRSGPGATVVEIKKIQRDSPSRSGLSRPGTTSGVIRRIR